MREIIFGDSNSRSASFAIQRALADGVDVRTRAMEMACVCRFLFRLPICLKAQFNRFFYKIPRVNCMFADEREESFK